MLSSASKHWRPFEHVTKYTKMAGPREVDSMIPMKPKSLFHVCLEYIARNMIYVESLNGVPEIIGEALIDACLNSGFLLANDEATQYSIRLFIEAYGKTFLERLKCSRLCMNEYGECLTIMCLSVTHLDISNCQLGNNSDFLRAIVAMRGLKVLNLSQNELSNDGFRLLFARYRMFKEGFQALESCDVSKNIVSLKTFRTFLGMPKLRYICVSVAFSLRIAKFLQEWGEITEKNKFKIHHEIPKVASCVETKGMGAKVVTEWEKKTEEWESVRLRKVAQRSNFFNRSLTERITHSFKPVTSAERFDTYCYVRELSYDGPSTSEGLPERGQQEQGDSKRKFVAQTKCKMFTKKKKIDLNNELLKMYQ